MILFAVVVFAASFLSGVLGCLWGWWARVPSVDGRDDPTRDQQRLELAEAEVSQLREENAGLKDSVQKATVMRLSADERLRACEARGPVYVPVLCEAACCRKRRAKKAAKARKKNPKRRRA